MELVRGIKITDYCDQANLSTKDRLGLFVKVCQAIQHAHQKGIIHRDIKPSNILVTLHDGVPVPKVIDFGIAKATEGRLTDATVYTQLHQFIGTPAYMSPEQAEMSGLDIDTRSDIYSLGVLLYELLAGSTPFDAKELVESGIDAMRKTIREKEPPRPSTRLATLGADELTTTARRRSADTSKLLHQLKGDLDWIVMKCLEKDRQRRYDTANGLAADLKRHLNNEPVVARPPTAAYKFQKAFRRNKLVFSAAAAVAVALILGVIVVFHEEPAKAEPFLLDNLDRARRVLGEKHPTTMNLTSLAAGDYRMLNQLEKAEALALRVLELRRSALGEEHPMTLGSICILANIYVKRQQFDQAGPLTEQALTLSRRLPLEKSVFLAGHLSNLGWAYLEQGKVAEAGTLCELALQATRRKPDGNPLAAACTLIQLGAVRLAQEKYAEAEMLLREGSPFAEKYWADEAYRPYVGSMLGASMSGQKKYADAEPFLLQGYEGLQQRQASVPPYFNARRRITESLERLVQLYDAWGKPAQAAEWKQKLAAFQQAAKAAEKKGAQP
jgi:hypothetical protein